MSETKIAIVDFGPFLDGSNKQAAADAMLASFKDMGFVYLINHGLPKEKIDGMFDWSKRFFAQPTEFKQLAPHPPSGMHHRGYSPPGLEKLTQHVYDPEELAKQRAKASDVKESFECGRENEEMPNVWFPDGVFPGFKEACLDFFWACNEVHLTILRALALALGLPEEFFEPYHKMADNQLRLLHYPSVPCEDLENENISRIGAHTDFGSITLLLQDEVGGLEVEDPKHPGSFTPATPVEGALVVNAGDFLARWSNDMIPSAVHRVTIPANMKAKGGIVPDRYSIPYFCTVDLPTSVDCLPGTYNDERPKRYEPISARDYVMKRLAASYTS